MQDVLQRLSKIPQLEHLELCGYILTFSRQLTEDVVLPPTLLQETIEVAKGILSASKSAPEDRKLIVNYAQLRPKSVTHPWHGREADVYCESIPL